MTGPRLACAARTDQGRVRERNEDAFLARPERGLFVVADGMGGHEDGAYASALIRDRLDRLAPPESAPAFLREVERVLGECHEELRSRAGPDGVCGATVVALLAFDGHFACLWAGDSRLYRLRGGSLLQLTRDHSLVEELIASGVLGPDQARRHPHANRITRAVGAGERLELDALQDRIAPGDRFLLCSDGLTGEVEDGLIARLLQEPSLERAADGLLQAALDAGAHDNVTLVLVDALPEDDLDATLPGRDPA